MTQEAMSPAAPTPTVTANAADPLLAKWVHLYDQLEATRAMLKAAPQGPAAVELKDEIRRLQRLAGAALEMVAAEQERERSGRKS
jgi:hypothetical protein